MWSVCYKSLTRMAHDNLIYDDQWYLLVAVAAAILVMVINYMRGGRGRSLRLPPGPAGALPIIGHMHLLGPLPHQAMHELAKKHGPLMHLRLGSVHTIVASSPEMARCVLQTHDADMASRPTTAATKHLTFGDLGFCPAGPYWRRMRQLCVTELFSNRRLASFRAVREQEVRALLASLAADGQKNIPLGTVSVRPALLAASSNIICRMAFGSTLSELVAVYPDSDVIDMVTEAMELLGAFNVGDFIPWLACMDPQGYSKQMQALGSKLSVVLQDMIDRRRHRQAPAPAGAPPADLLDVLLSIAGEGQISDHNIKGVLMDMLLGGIDSSSTVVEWALAELLANPSYLELLQEELIHVVPKERLVQESDFECLPYLTAVVKETMRLHPIGPLLSPHESIKQCRINEYDIPAKARIHVNVWAIGRDPSVWSNPLKFNPQRFLNTSNLDELGVLAKHYHLLPFGSGRRGCPGWPLGLINVRLMLANIVHAFEWKLQPSLDVLSEEVGRCTRKSTAIDMSEKFGLVVKMAIPLIAIATPRLPLDLFSMQSKKIPY